MRLIQYNHNGSHSVVIPSEIMKLKGWKKGTGLWFEVDKRSKKVSIISNEEYIEKVK